MLLHGISPPITTPFYPDGQVYYKKLEHNVERFSRTPVAGIVVLGSTAHNSSNCRTFPSLWPANQASPAVPRRLMWFAMRRTAR